MGGVLMLLLERFLAKESQCIPYGCSYQKVGSPAADVYCFKSGSYQGAGPYQAESNPHQCLPESMGKNIFLGGLGVVNPQNVQK